MPQDYTLKLSDSSSIVIDENQLPEGFHALDNLRKDSVASRLVLDHVNMLVEAERPATWEDFAWPIGFLAIFALIILWVAKKIRDNPKLYDNVVKLDGKPNPDYGKDREKQEYITIAGNSFKLKMDEYVFILTKYSPYYNTLNINEKEKFILRIQKFIAHKTFFIHDITGFREMPVLISASAVQLTFGLEQFLLTSYPHIHVYPQEFLRTNPSICFLVGSVSGHSIYISWKHFLIGTDIPGDGQHVGLHELAHAYHCQNFEKGVNTDTTFLDYFDHFNVEGQKIFDNEKMPGNDFYSEYALKDFQEFWAESMEIYFERPVEMKEKFPELYKAVCSVLNQDHAKRISNI